MRREKLWHILGALWLPILVGGAAIFYHNAEIILFAALISVFLLLLGAFGWLIMMVLKGEI